MNSGSRDVGRDPDWDAARMVYKPHHPETYGAPPRRGPRDA